ncbi:MAG: inorganic pyrophosphatase [Christensenellaceae bacterium]|jgi:inorganic pyrophosphatase|nr:inorganic pyrophosphatase [Christensenellaceae bacterium]
MRANPEFWLALDRLIEQNKPVIDRPKGSAHPRYPGMIYPLDYGYLRGTSAQDGGGIDCFLGSQAEAALAGILVTVDLLKRESEIKLLLGCTCEEMALAQAFLSDSCQMKALLVERNPA